MIVVCEECGTKYSLDETLLKNGRARVKCKVCQNMLEITNSEPVEEGKTDKQILEELFRSPSDTKES